jgi:N-acetylneuraminic acid mutarotase
MAPRPAAVGFVMPVAEVATGRRQRRQASATMAGMKLIRTAGLVLLAITALAAGTFAWLWFGARIPAATPPWARMAPMSGVRSEMPATVLGGLVYVPGGLGWFGRTVATFEVYDPAADGWRSLPPLPEPRHHVGVAAVEGRVIVTGGFSGLDFALGSADAWAFDPPTGTWERLPDMPGRRGAHAMAAVDGVAYVIGGVGDDFRAVWTFDTAVGAWASDRAPLPTAREHLAAVTVDGAVYAIGGRWGPSGNLATVERYDPATDAWDRLPDLPTARSGLAAAVVDGRVHVVGGEDLNEGRAFDAHEVLDPAALRWEAAAPLTAPRHGVAAVGVDGSMYVIGGATAAGARSVYSMTATVDRYAP